MNISDMSELSRIFPLRRVYKETVVMRDAQISPRARITVQGWATIDLASLYDKGPEPLLDIKIEENKTPAGAIAEWKTTYAETFWLKGCRGKDVEVIRRAVVVMNEQVQIKKEAGLVEEERI